MGESSYIYWKIFYERITKESLFYEYDLKNIKLIPNSSSASIEEVKIRETFLSEELKLDKNIKEKRVSKEEPGIIRKRVANWGRLTVTTTSSEIVPSLSDANQPMFIPIVICIKVSNAYIRQTEELFYSLIEILFTNRKNYVNDFHNMIYSFAEFCSTLICLNHLTIPPPVSELIIEMPKKTITYTEGLIGSLPCENDIAIAHLFSLVTNEQVITIWEALLTEKNIIIYTCDVNYYFFVMKALLSLIYPLNWQFMKGIIPTLEILSLPTPYCFGIMKSAFSDEKEIITKLTKDGTKYVILNLDKCDSPILRISSDLHLCNPNKDKLTETLDAICKKFNIKRNPILAKYSTWHSDFAKRIQEALFDVCACGGWFLEASTL